MTTNLNLTNAITRSENAFLHQNGQVIDYRMHQAKDLSKTQTSRQDSAPLAESETVDEADFVSSHAQIPNKSSKALLSPVPKSAEKNLAYSEDGSVIESGNLDELIHEFVPRAHYVPSEDYQFTFLLASRLFLTPNRLLSEVYRRADQLAHMLSPESHPTYAMNLVNMLSQWMVWFPSDFRDESMMNRSRQMVKLIVTWHQATETRLSQLMQTLVCSMTRKCVISKCLFKFLLLFFRQLISMP